MTEGERKVSALKRLKLSLREAGVIGQQSRASTSKKAKKRGRPNEVGKNSVREKLNTISNALNPFELKVSKTKYDVVGRKVKGAQGRPGLSKQIGQDNRKKTLLVEMQNKNKAGGFVDRRFGENDPNMTPEEKMLERFAKERQQRNRNAELFNLEDEDLTHYGQSLADMDDFDEAGLGMSDDENGQIDRTTVSMSHFGGFEPTPEELEAADPDRKKSKAEVMKEVIAKSKFHKYERQKLKEEDDELRQELDDGLKDIQSILFAEAMKKEAAEREKNEPKVEKSDRDEAYDALVREMVFEKRARATDRQKTEEELALEEKEKLERAERHRKRRMEGLDSDSETEEAQPKRKRVAVADDLEDDFQEEEFEIDALGNKVPKSYDIQGGQSSEDESEEEGESGDEEMSGSGEEDDSEEEGESEEEEEDYSDLDMDETEVASDDEVAQKKKSGKVSKKSSSGDKKELPFTFPAPNNHDEFLELIDGYNLEDQMTIIHRIRVLHHIRLGAGNRQKLETLFTVLLDHIKYLCQQSPIPMVEVNTIVKHVLELSQQMPEVASEYAMSDIADSQKALNKALVSGAKSGMPSAEELLAFKIYGQIFPTSDLQHVVVTPLMLLLGQYLGQCSVRDGRDLLTGLFLCNMFLEFQTLSKRVVPEAHNFLLSALFHLAPRDSSSSPAGWFPMTDAHFGAWASELDNAKLKSAVPEAINFGEALAPSDEASEYFATAEFRAAALRMVVHLIGETAVLYCSTAAFLELYTPALELIKSVQQKKFSAELKKVFSDVEEKLARLLKHATDRRKPLQLQKHKAIPIASYLPKFEENYSIDRHYDPDRERSEMNKLKNQYKKERKGAIRELRKDNQFVARERIKTVKEKDTQYHSKMRSLMGVLSEAQGEMKKADKKKKK
ncbi:Nop14-like protein [Basidiobolus meristosporus CBS 931.73]|uniref:Nop14-like protein n=1 Tax=Basidiobolus meristosporus CBS 931.73 TaxID=1314790 RepID=A0A1Y1ZBV6_9FUNG|nr:Nop14-like protein [Basidiobolus meristosporus CBS 931.73]|eukprot:ORY07457.1 Nop14-like protein [Basidiobolus meristosporus CBS 931.73]